jgi:hypothetical protein
MITDHTPDVVDVGRHIGTHVTRNMNRFSTLFTTLLQHTWHWLSSLPTTILIGAWLFSMFTLVAAITAPAGSRDVFNQVATRATRHARARNYKHE